MKWFRRFIYIASPIFFFALSSYFTISILLKQQESVMCPDIRGQAVEKARDIVKDKGLSLNVLRYEKRNDIPYDHVTIQKPEANILTRKGRTVNVILSDGPRIIETPAAVGKTLSEAEDILRRRHLGVKKVVYVPGNEDGTVVAQAPAQGENTLEGHGVTLFVASGKRNYYFMPDLKKNDINNINTLLEEMDKKGIKYKTDFTFGRYGGSGSTFTVSIPVNTIFRGDDEVTVNVKLGG